MSVKINRIIRKLRETSSLFKNVSEHALSRSLQVFRVIELRETESMVLTGSEENDFLVVVLGRVEVRPENGPPVTLTPEDTGRKPFLLPRLPGRTFIEARDDSILVHVDAAMFDVLLILEQSLDAAARETGLPARYLAVARSSRLFQVIPVECAEAAFASMKLVDVPAGREIIRPDGMVEAFYVLVEGKAEKFDLSPDTGLLERSGELGPGSRFGEDGLLTGKPATGRVVMLTDGKVLALEKDDFNRLLQRPLVPEVPPPVARAMMESGHTALDVRLFEEYEMEHLPGATLVELHELHGRMASNSQQTPYVVYCRSGRRSSVATFWLTQNGFSAVNLVGGIQAWPYEKEWE
ncbi:MAG: cyclic nucleotide-binding domain-containing protein [Thermodesulfobacteriota bacterium]